MKRFQIRRVRTVLLAMSVLVACSKNPAPSGMPGALSKAVSAYTGDEFHDFVSKLQYTGGHERERQCKNDPACAGTKRTVVRVDAIATEDSLGVTNTPQFGVVYARAINKGDAEETRYGMAPGKQFEYYLVVTADTGRTMRWTLQQLDTTPSARKLTQIGTGAFTPCNHKWVKGARADFEACDKTKPMTEDAPIWVSCEEGCCVGGI